MAERTNVRALLLQIDANVELLRQKLRAGGQTVDRFASSTDRSLDRVDRRFAQLGRPSTGFASNVRETRAGLLSVGTAADRASQQVHRSLGGMRTALLASAATFTAAVSADRLAGLADTYTRYTNQLKISGLEGEALARVQDRLFGTAQKYGAELEAIGTLYGRLAQSAPELGASQEELLQFTNGVGAALKVQGGDPKAATGALLQLSQAMGSTIVRAEEFNSINEGARPILVAVANGIERFGGSVAKLRAGVIAGKVTSQEFFQGFLSGSAQLEAQAERAQLTIGASFTVLNNALAKYIGEADAGLGATSRISQGIVGLANNLDLIAPALAVIGLGFTARFAAGPIMAATAAAATLRTELMASNVVLLGGKTAIAQKAQAAATAAATEVAAIEKTIAAKRADAAALRDNLKVIQQQRDDSVRAQQALKENARLGFGTVGVTRSASDAARAQQDLKALIATRRALGATNKDLAVLEGLLANAQRTAGAATIASTEATKAATLAARAGALANRFLAGSLALVGGWTGAAVLAVGALITVLMAYRAETRDAAADQKRLEENTLELKNRLRELEVMGRGAAGGIAAAGNAAATGAGQMLSFAGAVGEAARQLETLAKRRREERQAGFIESYTQARADESNAQARLDQLDRQLNAGGRNAAAPTLTEAQRAEQRTAREALVQARSNRLSAARAYFELQRRPLDAEVTDVDRNQGRDVDGELVRLRRDLRIARQRGNREQIADLQAQEFEASQFKKYRADGLSVEAATQQSQRDRQEFTQAAGDRAARAAGSRATRAASASERARAAEVRDAASDARAYAAAERQANNDIAQAQAVLTNSFEERARIEKARIDSERISRNEEIETQGPGGLKRFTAAQVEALKALNDQRASLEAQAVDLEERRRVDAEALAIASAANGNQQDLLRSQATLARTADARRTIEYQLLDLQYQEEEARLRAINAANGATDAEIQIAQARLAILGQLRAADREEVRLNTAGPLESYIESLPRDAAEAAELIEALAVDKLRDLNEEIADVVTGAKSIEDAFADMAKSIIRDLVRIAVQQKLIKPLAENLFGGTEAGGGSGGLFGSLARLFGGGGPGISPTKTSVTKGRRGGGSVYPGEDVIVGEDGPERVRFRHSARVIPTGGLRSPGVSQREVAGARGGAGSSTVRIEPSKYFDAVVDGRARAIAEPLAVEAAQVGAQAGAEAAVAKLTKPGL